MSSPSAVDRPPSRANAVAPHFTSIAAAETARYATDPDPAADYVYARFGTAASRALERRYDELLGASWSSVVTSGTTAIDVALSACLLSAPDRDAVVLVTEGLYVGTRRYFERILAGLRGVRVVIAPYPEQGGDISEFAEAVRRERPVAVFTESVTNPFLAVGDVPGMSRVCGETGAVLVVDATVTPPPTSHRWNSGPTSSSTAPPSTSTAATTSWPASSRAGPAPTGRRVPTIAGWWARSWTTGAAPTCWRTPEASPNASCGSPPTAARPPRC